MLYRLPANVQQVAAHGRTFIVDDKGHIDLAGVPHEILVDLVNLAGATPADPTRPAIPPIQPPVVTAESLAAAVAFVTAPVVSAEDAAAAAEAEATARLAALDAQPLSLERGSVLPTAAVKKTAAAKPKAG